MADNAIDPKYFMVFLEIMTAVVLLIEVGILIPNPTDKVTTLTELSCDLCLELLLAGIEVINLM
jgi:hypothetical protein